MGFWKLKRELENVKDRLDHIETAFRRQEERFRHMDVQREPETEKRPLPAKKAPGQPKI